MSPYAIETMSPNMMGASKASKVNIGVYTNPKHDLWLAEAEPSLQEVQSGQGLKAGEVTVLIKSTGICG